MGDASMGVNATMQSLCHSPKDHIVLLECAYPMVANTAFVLEQHGRATVSMVALAGIWPTDEAMPARPTAVSHPRRRLDTEAVLRAVDQTLASVAASGGRVAVAIFSHIVSKPALVLPVERLARLCKQRGVHCVCIDGAHAPGQLDLQLDALLQDELADVYVANCHKWLFCSKGTAILATTAKFAQLLEPTVISSEALKCDGLARFAYLGTRDYVPWCSVNAALDYREALGDGRIKAYCARLAQWAGHFLSERWGTQYVYNGGSMVNVELPLTVAQAHGLYDWLASRDVSLCVFALEDPTRPPWARVSCPLYTSEDDIEHLAKLVMDFKQE
jgi:selenocysteine lyase/cysteine desulfurase